LLTPAQDPGLVRVLMEALAPDPSERPAVQKAVLTPERPQAPLGGRRGGTPRTSTYW
jgi:hypothetical protein